MAKIDVKIKFLYCWNYKPYMQWQRMDDELVNYTTSVLKGVLYDKIAPLDKVVSDIKEQSHEKI